MPEETAETSMFDDIQTMLFANRDRVGRVFRVLNKDLRLCLICNDVFAPQVAAEHAKRVCYPK